MKISLRLFLICFLAGTTLFAQSNKPLISKTPFWVSEIVPDYNCSVNVKDVQDGYFYILTDNQQNVEEKSFFNHLVLSTFSDAGVQNASQVSVDFNPEYSQLFFHKIELIRNGKKINKLDLSKIKVLQRETDLERNIYDGTNTAVLILEDVRKGDIIEYSYSIKGRNPVFSQKFATWFYTQYSVPVAELSQQIICSQDRKLTIIEFNNSVKPVIQTQNNKTIYQWHSKNVKPLIADDRLPSWYDPYPYTMVSEYKNWAEVKDWAKELFSNKITLGKELKDTIAAINGRNASPEDKVIATVRFVQNQIRYMGIEIGVYSHLPNSPEKVFSQRFGDCKDKSRLLCAMLNELQIEAHPVLISTSAKDELLSFLPSPHLFNHCTVQIRLGGQLYWVDPTISYQGGDLKINTYPDYRWGLVVTDSSTGLTKINAVQDGKVRVSEEFDIHEIGGSCDLTVNTIYEGDEADIIRYQIANSSIQEMEGIYKNFYAKLYPGIRYRDSLKLVDYPALNKYTTTEYYTIDHLWQKDSLSPQSAEKIKADFEALLIESYITLPTTRIRKMPVNIRHKTNVLQTIQIKLPEAWTMEQETGSYSTSAFNYYYKYLYDDLSHVITLEYNYETKKDFIPTEETEEYIRTINKIFDHVSLKLTYNKNSAKEQASASSASPTNWSMVAFVIFYGLVISYVFFRLYFLNAPAEPFEASLDPVPYSIGGWLVLALIGTLLRPIAFLINILSSKYFNAEHLRTLSEQNSYWTLAITFEVISNVTLFLFSIFLLILFLKYRNTLPRFYVVFMSLSLILSILDVAIVKLLLGDSATISMTTVSGNIIACAIWIPYFMVSQRVKSTFVIKYKAE